MWVIPGTVWLIRKIIFIEITSQREKCVEFLGYVKKNW